MEQFFQWDERQLAVGELSTSYIEIPNDKHSLKYLKTNPTRNLLLLGKYTHQLVMETQSVPGMHISFSFQGTFARSHGVNV